MQEMVNKMKDHARDGLNYDGKCFISHSACFEDARKVADLVEAAFPNLKGPVLINSIGSVIGAHTGPGTVAIFFEGDPRKE
jgi:fatty acid-binding protein DegV